MRSDLHRAGEYSSLTEAICDLYGPERTVRDRRPVSGGDINDAYTLMLDDGSVLFMKSNTASAFDMFRAEAAGLAAIRATGTIRTPGVLAAGEDGSRSFLLMEYLQGGRRIRDYWETFADELAMMHKAETDPEIGYGFARDNYIGSGKQINTPRSSWVAFFRDCRLTPQFRRAERYFDPGDRKKISSLLDNLDRYLPEPAKPSLLHGDLWGGNYMTGDDGKAWLIDPAVYYGHPEADLAMTQLFGGFAYEFYEEYRDVAGLDSGYSDRRDLYNLYHLVNHLNLFGGGYLSSVRSILRRYA